jgi:hypothetical protein
MRSSSLSGVGEALALPEPSSRRRATRKAWLSRALWSYGPLSPLPLAELRAVDEEGVRVDMLEQRGNARAVGKGRGGLPRGEGEERFNVEWSTTKNTFRLLPLPPRSLRSPPPQKQFVTAGPDVVYVRQTREQTGRGWGGGGRGESVGFSSMEYNSPANSKKILWHLPSPLPKPRLKQLQEA